MWLKRLRSESKPLATDLIEINAEEPSAEALERAASAILRGRIVSIPTEARYVLVADPFNLRAVANVYRAKGRESIRSLPLLISDHLMAEELASEISARFRILARHYWPGPLTIIVPASAKVPLKVTGNTGRLALRQSKCKTAQALVEKMGQPLIATSANVSGQPTCASGIEVFGTMDGRVDLVLDGGAWPGPGPTTIDITEPYWRVIKEGAIREKELAEVLHRT
jgi:L-threonylcarbamoyladenylate synthase